MIMNQNNLELKIKYSLKNHAKFKISELQYSYA